MTPSPSLHKTSLSAAEVIHLSLAGEMSIRLISGLPPSKDVPLTNSLRSLSLNEIATNDKIYITHKLYLILKVFHLIKYEKLILENDFAKNSFEKPCIGKLGW